MDRNTHLACTTGLGSISVSSEAIARAVYEVEHRTGIAVAACEVRIEDARRS